MRHSKNTLYCFSPPVMLATFIIEIGLLIYTLARYRFTTITKISAALLFFLALFQLSEYNVCGSFQLSAAAWSRVGYIAITMLPPLGIHLVQVISGRGWPWLKWAAYASGIVWALTFGLTERAFTGHVCAGNYVIFQLNSFASTTYTMYYYFWLLVGIVMAGVLAAQAKGKLKEALWLMVLCYLVFLVPTAIVERLKPETVAGIPSIMCGFAILFAFILVLGILPIVSGKETKADKADKADAIDKG